MGARLPALLALAVCLPLAGCGDDDVGDPIPAAKAQKLSSQIETVRAYVDQDLCDDAQTSAQKARATVDTLDDDGVGADVQDALGDGVDNLGSLVSQECQVEEPIETTPQTTPVEPTTPETTTTETTETETTPPPEPEPTTPAPEPEPDEDSGGEQFDPNAVPPGQAKKDGDD